MGQDKKKRLLSGYQQWCLFSVFIGFFQQMGILQHQGWQQYLLYAVGTAIWYMVIGGGICWVVRRFNARRASVQMASKAQTEQKSQASEKAQS
ncbi:hypothetical protein [Dongshaea marina]|uniref:hypothetical protein n=1 Tax=Dongshaea marina TaxID=2047966 RepID=UPI000D3EC8BF|nr:hypothetical protein [Dongshaea marina]